MTTPMLSRLRRFGRATLTLLLALLLLLVGVFAYNYLRHPATGSASTGIRVLLACLFVAGPAWILFARFCPAHRPALPRLALIASLALFLGWLATDDATIRHDPDHPALRSDFPEAAATHALVLRYSKDAPDSLYDTFTASKILLPSLDADPVKREKWTAFITENRAAIETRWNELQALRNWFDEMAAAPRLGDLLTNFDDPIPAFAPMREVARFASAQACLLALEGRNDEAVALLIPVFDAAQKLEANARTLVRRMVAIVLQRQTLSALEYVLDQGELSAATRDELSRVLRPSLQDPAEGARLLCVAEYGIQSNLLLSPRLHQLGYEENSRSLSIAPTASFFFYNPKATVNRAGDILHAMAEAGAKRDAIARQNLDEQIWANRHPSRFLAKNLIGTQLIELSLPAYNKVIESYWSVHDRRQALLARL
jgi:hypothetical protein